MLFWILVGIIIFFLTASIEHFTSIQETTMINCNRRNMSTDLRGEAYYPPRTNYSNSELGPYNCLQNKNVF